MRCSKDSSESVFERLFNVRWLVLADQLEQSLEKVHLLDLVLVI